LFDWRDELGIATRRVAELEAHFLAQTQRVQWLVQQKKSPIADERILAIVCNSLEHARSHKQLVESKFGEQCPAQSEDCAQNEEASPTYPNREIDFSPPQFASRRDARADRGRKAQSSDGVASVYDQMLKIMAEIAMEADESKI